MIGAMKRHEVQVLRKAGLTLDEVARQADISKRSVQRIVEESPVEPPLPARPAREAGVGRPSTVGPFRKIVEEILAEQADLPTIEVLHRLRQKEYTGGKSALYELVAKLRPPSRSPMVRFEGLPGEFSQHDFGEVIVRYLNGTREKIHFFASRLKYSRFAYVEVVPDQKVEALVRALLRSFEAFGGVPLVGVFDNPKTIVIKRVEDRIDWNTTFAPVPLDFRFAVELCTPRRANQKGAVENLVGWVKNSFFKVRRFLDREDILSQLADWLRESNAIRPSRATGQIPQALLDVERHRLRPLPISPPEYALRFPVVVGPTGQVEHDRIRYSMPAESIGFHGTLFLFTDRVRIVAGRHEAHHARIPATGRSSFLPEHRASLLARVSGDRGKLYFQRQQLLDLGPVALDFLTELVHRHPYTWRGEVEHLFELLQRHGDLRLTEALRSASSRKLFASRYVADALEAA